MMSKTTAENSGYSRVEHNKTYKLDTIKQANIGFRKAHQDLSVISVVENGVFMLYAKPKADRPQDRYERTLVELLNEPGLPDGARKKIRDALDLE